MLAFIQFLLCCDIDTLVKSAFGDVCGTTARILHIYYIEVGNEDQYFRNHTGTLMESKYVFILYEHLMTRSSLQALQNKG